MPETEPDSRSPSLLSASSPLLPVFPGKINKRKMRYLGHAVRNPKTGLMATILQGRVEGKRNRGRPKTLYMDNVTAISGLTLAGVMHRSRDREDWRTVVARSEAATDDHSDADR